MGQTYSELGRLAKRECVRAHQVSPLERRAWDAAEAARFFRVGDMGRERVCAVLDRV